MHLQASEDVLAGRVTHRRHEYMPPTLLHSQLDTLEPLADDEPGVRVATHGDPDAVAACVLETLESAGGR